MIVVQTKGGLGNQLFQYAIGRSLSLELNRNLVIDKSWYRNINMIDSSEDNNATTKREYILGHFKIKGKIAKTSQLDLINRIDYKSKTNKYYNLLLKNVFSGLRYTSVDQSNYSLELIKNSSRVYLTGYWQNNSIIYDYRKDLIEDITLVNNISIENQSYLKSIKSTNSVAIHFRRGDYLSKPNSSKLHATCSKEYYQKSIELIQNTESDVKYFIFSDEIEWVKNNIQFPQNTFFIENYGPDFEHFYLMSMCKHQVTANSTFSWWAAWLNQNSNKLIITPKYWYYDNDLYNTIIRIPNNWIKINNLNK